MTVTHYFSFGSGHMTSYPLPRGGQITDYLVAVELPDTHHWSHREVFIRDFTTHYCLSPMQFAMEYDDTPPMEFFQHGELMRIIVK